MYTYILIIDIMKHSYKMLNLGLGGFNFTMFLKTETLIRRCKSISLCTYSLLMNATVVSLEKWDILCKAQLNQLFH
jgi:hypothetical protein